uniref:Uncharacterized protein n=1 Tax=Candidatus Kentrum sp. SD TaxID=2126332 RepID=A0A451BS61_9GAMM|nr:MAG: hypothetical protein BECKSD772D_GA0070982_12194 [Candidatus Kentron sp. SD]
MDKALKYLTSWSFMGLVFSILGTISLFGELGIITFSEWLNNVIDAYQLLVYPLFKLIFSPLLTVLDLDIDPWEIDLIVIVFFFLNRFLADMVAYAFLQILKNDTPAKKQRSFILGVKYRSARRILVYLYKLEGKLSKYNIIMLAIIRNLVLLSALILLTKIFSGIEVSRPERVEVLHIVIFFAALYVFPLFNLAVMLFYLAIGGTIYRTRLDCARNEPQSEPFVGQAWS